jgi:putative GTP pyrophosphokinase
MSLTSSPNKTVIKKEYEEHAGRRHLIVNDIKDRVDQLLVPLDSNPVVSGRIKSFSSYFSKYLRLLKTENGEPKITDLLGVRVICPFIEDLSATENLIRENFLILETERKGHVTFKEFGYESTHILIKIPQEIIDKRGYPGTDIVEIQIRTILQDAWAEVEHELVYKTEFNPFDEPMKRKLAAVNANLSLADIIFQEIRTHQRKYSKEMLKRRESFFQKIEESTDKLLFAEEEGDKIDSPVDNDNSNAPVCYDNVSIDDLLVLALTAHNQKRFNEAISHYSKILDLEPAGDICSIIYKHRGMANFACSRYNEAINDFSNALKFDEKSYKAAYCCGIVHSVLKQYLQAIESYNLSLSIYPYQSFCLFRRAQAYYHIDDYMQALSDCEKSLALEPGNKSVIKFKGLLMDKLRM